MAENMSSVWLKGLQTPDMLNYVQSREYNSTNKMCRLLDSRLSTAKCLFTKDLKAHYGCVNAIEFSNDGGRWLISGGDDRRVLLWNVEKALSLAYLPRSTSEANAQKESNLGPTSMKGEHHSNIFCLAFDCSNKKIFSGGNDEQAIVHDIETGELTDVFLHSEAVYGLATDPVNDSVFASACDDGRILIFDIREPATEDPFCLASFSSPMHAVVYNPVEPRLLATANSKEGITLWDIRKPKTCLMRYGGSLSQQSCMSVRFNKQGNSVIALRRRQPPVLYRVDRPEAAFQFDHSGYYNSCTMKSCCFAGESDQYVLSGSDDFNLYMWKIPEEPTDNNWVSKAHLVLKGHRSIVNQVRCNPSNNLIVSSGVEKVVKMWSPFPIPGCQPATDFEEIDLERPAYTHEEYISLVLHSGTGMTHDYSQQSTEEDPRMMAFFDSLVQRELEGLTSDDLESEPEVGRSALTNIIESESEDLEESPSGEDRGYSPFTIAFASVTAQREAEQESGGERVIPEVVPRESIEGAASPQPAVAIAGLAHAGNVEVSLNIDTEQPAQEGAEGSWLLPGQRPNITRVSISSLIAQKRLEYLTSIQHREKRTKRKHQQSSKRHAKHRIKRTRYHQYDVSSSDSTSDDDDQEISSSDSSSDSAETASHQDVHTALQQLTSKNQTKTQNYLQRWKQLRDHILNSDSDHNDSGQDVPSESDSKSKTSVTVNGTSTASDTDLPGTSSQHLQIHCHRDSEGDKDQENPDCEMGPHISEMCSASAADCQRLWPKHGPSNCVSADNQEHGQKCVNSLPCTSNGNSSLCTEDKSNQNTLSFKKRSDVKKRRYRGHFDLSDDSS